MFHAKFTSSNLFYVFFFIFLLLLCLLSFMRCSKAFDHEFVFICVCVYENESELLSHSIYLAFLFSLFYPYRHITVVRIQHPILCAPSLGFTTIITPLHFSIVLRIHSIRFIRLHNSLSIFDLVDMVKGKSSMLTHRSETILCSISIEHVRRCKSILSFFLPRRERTISISIFYEHPFRWLSNLFAKVITVG